MLPDSGTAELIALAVVVLLGLAMRWVFRPSRGRTGVRTRPVDAAVSPSLGLLTVIATLPRQQAVSVRTRLQGAGIRSSISRRHDGRYDLLVFEGDADRARIHLAP
jgi:hypothetical protein